jgi:acyl-homoserine-lactone acylase
MPVISISRFLGALALTICLFGCDRPSNTVADTELARQQDRAANVTIIRDDFGVPHVYGKSDADAVFGLLYAQSEDDFPRVERNYIWAIGRLAEVEGEEALFSDLRARLFMTEEEARAAYQAAPPWLQELCVAFADGVNYYLATHPQVTPALLTHFEPWMPMYFFEGSIGGDIEQIPLAGIRALYGAGAGVEAAVMAQPTAEEPSGSNGFAISGELTESGNAMLLINPHTSFFFRGEVHMVSEAGLNAYGAVTWGQFFVYQGFNEDTGWMHTSTYVDFIDEFVEDITRKNGSLQYRYGEEQRPLEVGSVTLKYRQGEGVMTRTFPTYRTHHGPITHQLEGKWVATRINWDPVNALRQSFLRTKQADHTGFDQIMQIRTNSSNNTVFADSSGNIAYYHGNFVPRRDPRFDFSQAVDGSDPATDWQGIHSLDDIVSLLNPANGWLQNCNSTPFTAAGAMSPNPADYPTYMAPDPENFRAVHAVQLLEGLAGGEQEKLSLETLITLAYDPRLPAFELLLPPLIAAYEAAPRPALAAAIETLRNWDYRVSLDSSAMTMAHFYGEALLQGRDRRRFPGRMQWMQQDIQATTGPQKLDRLEAVLAQLEADFDDRDIPWGKVNRFQRLDGAIESHFDDSLPSLAVPMASGRWGALAAFGARAGPNTKQLYGYRGNSFVAVVEFGDKVRALTLLAGGQSGDPGSPHFDDQVALYVAHRFKPVAYYRPDVEARAQQAYRPGEMRSRKLL